MSCPALLPTARPAVHQWEPALTVAEVLGAAVMVGVPLGISEGAGETDMLGEEDEDMAGVDVGEVDEPETLTRRRARKRRVVVGQLPPW